MKNVLVGVPVWEAESRTGRAAMTGLKREYTPGPQPGVPL